MAVSTLRLAAPAYAINLPISKQLEQLINASVKNYHVTIGGAKFNFMAGKIALENVVIVQKAHPTPPIAVIPEMLGSIEPHTILMGRVSGSLTLKRPRLFVDLAQLRQQTTRNAPVSKQGWQTAVEKVFPFTIQRININRGDLTYASPRWRHPLHLLHLDLAMSNVSNAVPRPGKFPSPIKISAMIFGTGKVAIDGAANLLTKPYPAIKAHYNIGALPLDPLDSAIKSPTISAAGGVLKSSGTVEYAPWAKSVDISDAAIDKIKLNYARKPSASAMRGGAQVKPAPAPSGSAKPQAGSVGKQPEWAIRIGTIAFNQPRLLLNLGGSRATAAPSGGGLETAALARKLPHFAINQIQINDAGITYAGGAFQHPVVIQHFNFTAAHLVNPPPSGQNYPSAVQASATIFGQGKFAINGAANFFAQPYPAIEVNYVINTVPLAPFETTFRSASLNLIGGVVQSGGVIEYAPWAKVADIANVTIDRIRLDYISKAAPKTIKTAAAVPAPQPGIPTPQDVAGQMSSPRWTIIINKVALQQPQVNLNMPGSRSRAPVAAGKSEGGGITGKLPRLTLNEVKINDGNVTYEGGRWPKPLNIRNLNFTAYNIQNPGPPDQPFPSTLHLDANIFGRGKLTLDGTANLFQKPYPAVKLHYLVQRLPLRPFRSMISGSSLRVSGGKFEATGSIQYAPWIEFADVQSARVGGVDITYIKKKHPAAPHRKHPAAEAIEASYYPRGVTDDPPKTQSDPSGAKGGFAVVLQKLIIANSKFTFVDETKSPTFKLDMSHVWATATNFTKNLQDGAAKVRMIGDFMGSGDAFILASFKSTSGKPDFTANVAIRNTDVTSLNKLWKAYGRLTLASGRFSLFAQMGVHRGRMQGYVKPIFTNLEVYSFKRDINKPFWKQGYELLAGGLSEILQNWRTGKLATQFDVSGRLKNPKINTLQAVEELASNAFVKAILPGFDERIRLLPP